MERPGSQNALQSGTPAMTKRPALASLLLLTTQLVAPAALAQSGGTSSPSPSTAGGTGGTLQSAPQASTPNSGQPQAGDTTEQDVEVSAPGVDASAGEDIVVVGRNIPNVVRSTAQIVSVLSTADIARSGEGDIAGALTRVTGLSVVGGGFVFVRGLGDRYSSSLLNGSPLPSPEPLRRSVPLDIFPTSIVGSALVQKTYSVNYPGEFGGGVVNLTTKAIPEKNFLTIGGTIAADTYTTSNLGYTYHGGDADWVGYDDGTRSVPGFIRNAPGGSGLVTSDQVLRLSNAATTLLQRNNHLPANFSAEVSGGSVFDIGTDRLGLIASLGLSNTWRTRLTTQQDSTDVSGALRNDYRTLITDNRAVVNALIGAGYEFGPNTIRLTNVYIHDTLKQARGAIGLNYPNFSGTRFQQNTAWFERQLIETQLVGEFKPTDRLKLDGRFAYANSKRNAPYERQFDYLCTADPDPRPGSRETVQPGPNGETQCDTRTNAGRVTPGVYAVTSRFTPFASIVFSELNEDLYTGQGDAAYTFDTDRPLIASAGYFYADTERSSSRLNFNYQTSNGPNSVPGYPFNLYRPDFLLSPDIVNNATPLAGASTIQLQFNTPLGAYQYDAKLRIHAGYGQLEAEAADGLRATIGVRYEDAAESVTPIGAPTTRLRNDYFLPAATITWNFRENMQLRASASKTLSRPQFRELAPQQFRDPDSDRLFFGNPNLVDSELFNTEARYEWYFGRDQRFSLAGFYKRLDNPIEQVGFFPSEDSRLQTGFTNLPRARLYGGEVEVQKYVPLAGLGAGFETRRILLLGNYTYTKSRIAADDSCVAVADGSTRSLGGCPAGFVPASAQFRDKAPLTGQSDHLVNVQVGIDDTDRLSQLTLLFNYASKRVTNRGPFVGGILQPDVYEKPGIRLDVVARQAILLPFNRQVDLKFEARNLTGTPFQEYQTFGDTRVFANRFEQGRIFSLGLSTTF